MKILVLTQYYYPEPVEKIHDLAKGLMNLGNEVSVLTGSPCYPTGKIYNGYKNRWVVDSHDGVSIYRVPQFSDHSRSAIRRSVYYLSFAISALIYGSFLKEKPDVILVYLAALPVGITGWLLSKRFKVPFILDVVDLWPESVSSSGIIKNDFIENIIQKVARLVYNKAKLISVVTEGFKVNIVNKGIEESKICVINNWMPSETYLDRSENLKSSNSILEKFKDKFLVMYAGNIGPFQSVETIIDAANILKNNDEIIFVIVGNGVEYRNLVEKTEKLNLLNIIFLGRKKPEEMPNLYDLTDILIVHLVPSILADISIPSKTFAYMTSGKPVIMAVKGEAEKFINENGFGISVQPVNPQNMASGILTLFNKTPDERKRMGILGKENYRKYYSGEVQINKFNRILKSVVD